MVLTGLLALGVLTACGNEDPDDATDTGATSSPSTSATPTESTNSQSATPDPGADATSVPLYFVGETPQGTRLYREYQGVDGDPAAGALKLISDGPALDPDYAPAVPAGSLTNPRVEGDIIRVDLTDAKWASRPADLSNEQAEMALQAVIYTLQELFDTKAPLQVLGPDGKPSTYLDEDTLVGAKAADELGTLALASITNPSEGAEVSGVMAVDGRASSFEATVPWEIRQGDKVVLSGFYTAEGWIDGLYPWSGKIDISKLEPGDYVFAAFTDDPSSGETGGPHEDTRTITVK